MTVSAAECPALPDRLPADATEPVRVPSPAAPRGRRALFAGLGLAAAVTGARDVLAPTEASASSRSRLLHLLRRTTYGPTTDLLDEATKLGYNGWLEAQLNPSSIPDPVVDAMLPRWPRLNLKIWEAREQLPTFGSWDLMYDVGDHFLARAIWSKRQLLESMVGLWTNHLVVPVPSSEVWDSAHRYQIDVIRRYALSSYASLLWSAARHPALLRVLDNANSSKTAPNENFARELLELHTVGVGNYTEEDVKNSARALTGLSVDSESGMYEFKPERHWVGPVKVLGWSSPNATAEGGEAVAKSYLLYLARHRLTATRIITKLCVRFVSDTPPSKLVARLTDVYLANDTKIVPVLRALFTSEEFLASAVQKNKTPLEDAIASIRVLGLQPPKEGSNDLRSLTWTTGQMGQAPMGWPAPNGYPDVATAWAGASSTLARWNFHLGLTGAWALRGMARPNLTTLLAGTPKTYGDYVDQLAAALLLPKLNAARKGAICTFLDHAAADPLKASDAALGWRLPYVVGLLLDSPNHAAR